MAAVEHTYSYLAPSSVSESRARGALHVRRPRAHPWFFSGFLGAPRQTAQALLVVAEVARTRYYEPPGWCGADPRRRPRRHLERRPAALRVLLGLRRRLCAARPRARRCSTTRPRRVGHDERRLQPADARRARAGARRRRDADARRPRRGARDDARRLGSRAQGAAARALAEGLRGGAGRLRAHARCATS